MSVRNGLRRLTHDAGTDITYRHCFYYFIYRVLCNIYEKKNIC